MAWVALAKKFGVGQNNSLVQNIAMNGVDGAWVEKLVRVKSNNFCSLYHFIILQVFLICFFVHGLPLYIPHVHFLFKLTWVWPKYSITFFSSIPYLFLTAMKTGQVSSKTFKVKKNVLAYRAPFQKFFQM